MMTVPRVFLALVFCLPVVAQTTPAPAPASSAAQSATQSNMPKIVSHTQLVLVPVVVTDKSGKHVEHLTKDAFKVEENGKAQDVSVFEEVRTETVQTAPRPENPQIHSNYTLSTAHPYRLTVVVLDLLNTPFLAQGEARRQLLKYLSHSLHRDEPTSLLGLGRKGLQQLHPFTTDTAVLIAALHKVNGEISSSEVNDSEAATVDDIAAGMQNSSNSEAQQMAQFMNDQQSIMNAFQQRERTETTLESLRAIAQAYAALPGRKTLIWATAGFPFMIDDPLSFGRMGVDMLGEYEETWRALMSANIAVYTVDVQGLTNPEFITGGGMNMQRRNPRTLSNSMRYSKSEQQQATLRAFSEATGGRPCVNTNDLAKCYAQAVADSSAYYLLGFYLGPDDRKPGWRKLKVKVSAESTRVHAREGFYVSGPDDSSVETRRKLMIQAVTSPVEFTGVRFTVRQAAAPNEAAAKPQPGGKIMRYFILQLQPKSFLVDHENSNLINLDLLLLQVDKRGMVVAESGNQIEAKLKAEMDTRVSRDGLAIKENLEMVPGDCQVKAVIRDNLTGQIGTVAFPFEDKKLPESEHPAPASN